MALQQTLKKETNQKMVGQAEEDFADAWLVIRAIPGKERLLISAAEGEGFQIYRPVLVYQSYNKFHRQVTLTTTPMFPGYMLCKPTRANAYKIFTLMGILPGRYGVSTLALLDDVVTEIRSREKDGIIDLLKPKAKPKRGQRVKTLGGLIDAIVSEPIDNNRIGLITGMFKGAARFTCSLDHVIQH